MRAFGLASTCLLLAVVWGCIGQTTDERNPFLTATETYGASLFGDDSEDGVTGAGIGAEDEFRQTMTVTLANNHASAELNVRFAAWVKASSIRSADQQDALLADGYVQLTREERLGTAFVLPPGTFVYNGPGTAGATTVRLAATGGPEDEIDSTLATTREFVLITPDVILLFMEPPVSCESVAFNFTREGFPVDDSSSVRATGQGGRKTLAQVDVYECDPFHPGAFFKIGGGARDDNEYFEGDDIRVDFFLTPNAAGDAAIVTIGAGAATTTGQP